MRAAKTEFYRKKLDDNSADSRGTWKIINNFLGAGAIQKNSMPMATGSEIRYLLQSKQIFLLDWRAASVCFPEKTTIISGTFKAR